MQIFDRYPTIFVIIVVAVGAAVWLQFSEISLTGLGAADIGTKFLSLTFMALVIERSVEIYIKNRFGEEEAEIMRPARIAGRSVRLYKDALDAAAAAILPTTGTEAETSAAVAAKYEHVSSMQAELDKARKTLLTEKAKTEVSMQGLKTRKKRAATIAALGLSLAVAVVGLRVLAQFVPAESFATVAEAMKGTAQLQAFHAIDIVITALLLSGGADGIHQLVNGFLSDRDELVGTS